MPPRILVVVESPMAGHPRESLPTWMKPAATWFLERRNHYYALRCMRDSLQRGEAPYASHLMYDRVLDDHKNVDRAQGMYAGFLWGRAAQIRAVYCDFGISDGMRIGITQRPAGQVVEYRYLEAHTVCIFCGRVREPGHPCGSELPAPRPYDPKVS